MNLKFFGESFLVAVQWAPCIKNTTTANTEKITPLERFAGVFLSGYPVLDRHPAWIGRRWREWFDAVATVNAQTKLLCQERLTDLLLPTYRHAVIPILTRDRRPRIAPCLSKAWRLGLLSDRAHNSSRSRVPTPTPTTQDHHGRVRPLTFATTHRPLRIVDFRYAARASVISACTPQGAREHP